MIWGPGPAMIRRLRVSLSDRTLSVGVRYPHNLVGNSLTMNVTTVVLHNGRMVIVSLTLAHLYHYSVVKVQKTRSD